MNKRNYRYHVFLSHNSVQKDWVRNLTVGLREANLSVFFDEDSIELGEDIVVAIEDAIRNSRHILLVLSPEALASPWVSLELSTSLYRDPSAAARTIIPILRADCEIPLTIARLKYLDARVGSLDVHLERLLRAIEKVPIELTSSEMPKTVSDRHSDSAAQFLTGGTIPFNFPTYIERETDRKIMDILAKPNSVCTLWGSPQMGKSSMLTRVINQAKQNNLRTAIIDLSGIGGESLPQVLYAIAHLLQKKLNGDKPSPDAFLAAGWGPKKAFMDYVEACGSGFILAFDEVDYLRSIGELDSFFQMLRALYGMALVDGIDRRLLISSFLSPRHFIQDVMTSPFNIGYEIRLSNFTHKETKNLLSRGNNSLSVEEVNSLFNFTGGQPYLTHVSAQLLFEGMPSKDIVRSGKDPNGPFAMHLEMLRSLVNQSATASKVLSRYKSGKRINYRDIVYLQELNVLKEGSEQFQFSCGAYEAFFRDSF